MRVLLIEDDSAMAQSIELMLKVNSDVYIIDWARKDRSGNVSPPPSHYSTSTYPTCRVLRFCAACAWRA